MSDYRPAPADIPCEAGKPRCRARGILVISADLEYVPRLSSATPLVWPRAFELPVLFVGALDAHGPRHTSPSANTAEMVQENTPATVAVYVGKGDCFDSGPWMGEKPPGTDRAVHAVSTDIIAHAMRVEVFIVVLYKTRCSRGRRGICHGLVGKPMIGAPPVTGK